MSTIVGDYDQRVRVTTNGDRIFFDLKEIANEKRHIYSCKTDGTDLVRVVDGSTVNGWVPMHAAY